MMKWITTIISLFFGAKAVKPLNFNLKQIALEVADELALKTRKPVILILAGIVSIIFFCGGGFMAIFDATRQYDRTGTVYATATLWTGIGIAAFFAIAYTWVFLMEWPGAKRHHAMMAREKIDKKLHDRQHDDRHPPGIDQALSLFIMDMVEERRAKRSRRNAAAQAAASMREREREHESDVMAKAHPGYQEGPTEDPRGFA